MTSVVKSVKFQTFDTTHFLCYLFGGTSKRLQLVDSSFIYDGYVVVDITEKWKSNNKPRPDKYGASNLDKIVMRELR